MAATTTRGGRLPGPPELLPGRPDAVVDLQTADGARAGRRAVALLRRARRGDRLRRASARPDPIRSGRATCPTAPTTSLPHAEAADFDDSGWARARARRTRCGGSANGRVCFNWYRTAVTIPERVGDLDPTGATVVFEVVVDDYAEVWVDGELPLALGDTGGPVVGGFNAPNRVVLTRDARPGERVHDRRLRHQRPDLGLAAQLHLDAHGDARRLRGRPRRRRVTPAGRRRSTGSSRRARSSGSPAASSSPRARCGRPTARCCSARRTRTSIYRWTPERPRRRCSAPRAATPASTSAATTSPAPTGSTFDPEGRLTICQHGNRRVIRVEPARRHHRARRPLRGPAAQQPERPRLPLRRDAVLHRPAVRAARRHATTPTRSSRSAASSASRDGEVDARRPTSSTGPTGSRSRPTSASSTSATGTSTARSSCATRSTPTARSRPASVLYDMTDAPGEDAIDGIKVDARRQPLRLRPGRHLGALARAASTSARCELPEAPHNLAWGDDDGRTLYVTALTSVYRLRAQRPKEPNR